MSKDYIGTETRADKKLVELVPSLTNRQVEEAFEKGWIRHNGRVLKKGDKVLGAEILDVSQLLTYLSGLRAQSFNLQFSILVEEKSWVLSISLLELLATPISLFETDTVSQWALSRYPSAGVEFPEIQPALCPHRLDTETEGVQLVALTKKSFQEWREVFSKNSIEKLYLAWCWGVPKSTRWRIEFPIAHHQKKMDRMVAVTTSTVRCREPIQEAYSEVEVVEKKVDRFLAQIKIETGITHQVRVHLAACGFPLLGDSLYDENIEARSERYSHHRLLAFSLKYKNTVIQADKTVVEAFKN